MALVEDTTEEGDRRGDVGGSTSLDECVKRDRLGRMDMIKESGVGGDIQERSLREAKGYGGGGVVMLADMTNVSVR